MANLLERAYNPDILNCLANLSNDEVFTPPELANRMLDLLPDKIWKSRDVKILDPCCKTGVFLREAAKRLIEAQMPGYQERADNLDRMRAAGVPFSAEDKSYLDELQVVLDHVFRHQLYGIAISELTSLMTRRSLYCSKYPESKYSIVKFDNPEGNIDYKVLGHTWRDSKCVYCGVGENQYKRDNALESYAYEFIHLNDPGEVFNMQFDVIVGNPPYQLSDGGGEGSSAIPIYQKFIQEAIKLNPRYLSMIVPARWYSGGKGLDEFRNELLHDERLSVIHDFPETSLCFPNVNIRGGVCYFLWQRDHKGPTEVYNHSSLAETTRAVRPLLESGATTFIRYNSAIGILEKVRTFGEETYDKRVMSRNAFGIPSNYPDYLRNPDKDTYTLYRSRRGSSIDKVVYIRKGDVKKNIQLVPEIKVLVSKASPGGDEYPHAVFSTPLIAGRNSVCTETYLIVDIVKTQLEAESLISYMKTRFFRFLVALIKTTQNISRKCFAFVPIQRLDHLWTDAELFEKYRLDKKEQEFIFRMIKTVNDDDYDD